MKDLLYDLPRDLAKRPLNTLPTARWRPLEKILNDSRLTYNIDNPDDHGKKILLGCIDEKPIGINDDRHITTVAGSRSGKSVALKQNLVFYRGSVLVIDPKAELASSTAIRRGRGLGQDVYILDPYKRCNGDATDYRASFNPLSNMGENDPDIIENAAIITDALVVPNPDSKDPHWDMSAATLIEGVILHVCTAKIKAYENNRNLVTVWQLIANGTDCSESKSGKKVDHTGIHGLICEMQQNASRLKTKGEKSNNHNLTDVAFNIQAAALDFSERPDNEKYSVLSTARRHLSFLRYREMQDVLSDGERSFDLSELKTNPNGATIYMCLPASKLETCNRWLRLFINLTIDAMERVGEVDHSLEKPPVLMALDEFPVLGYMKQLETAAGLMAGFGVKMWTILQDLGQLEALYKDRWQTFLGNSGIIQFFGNNDTKTLEFIERRVGKTAIFLEQIGSTTPQEQRKDAPIERLTRSLTVTDLISAEEASRYFGRDDPLHRQLIIHSGHSPMILQRIIHYDDSKENRFFFDLFKEHLS